jgi:DNA-binding response OmpR family regulator
MSPHSILIVEDQREVSRLLRSTVETLEYKLDVVEIPSGEEAILYSSRKKVDLLVADYRLPGMTGIELMHKVQKNHPKVKIILVTGQTDPEIRKEVAEAGADAFFLKPIPMADFLDAVVHHLDLAETAPPPEPVKTEAQEEEYSLHERMADLQKELGANAVFLLNNNALILARAGELTDDESEASLISTLLAMQSPAANISRLIGQKNASNWQVFDGGVYDLVFTPVGLYYAILVIGEGIAGENLLKTMGSLSTARLDIEAMISSTKEGTLTDLKASSVREAAASGGKKGLTPLFEEGKKKLVPDEVNEFWNKAADNQKAPSRPDMLTYEQARELGLTPTDES